jgi:hypothetical protein
VCFLERARDLDRDVENLRDFELRGRHLAAQGDAVDVLGGDVVSVIVNSDFVDRENVRVI